MYLHFHPRTLARVATLACATALGPMAVADDGAAAPAPGMSKEQMLSGQPVMPPVREDNGIEHLIGGVGSDERARLKPLVQDMNLQLVFAEKGTGALLAEVEVSIADDRGEEILTVKDSDPWVFAELEPGTYRIKARSDKGTIERQVRVPENGRRTELFLWS